MENILLLILAIKISFFPSPSISAVSIPNGTAPLPRSNAGARVPLLISELMDVFL
jgi:hypothetical protein